MNANDLYQTITDRVIADIEAGADTWQMPWQTFAHGSPRSCDGRPYRGLNSLWLAVLGKANGWDSRTWGTYRAWAAKNCQVRRGEKGTHVLLWRETTRTNADGDTERFMVARAFAVFAAEQTDGGTEYASRRWPTVDRLPVDRLADAEQFFGKVGAVIRDGGDSAYYHLDLDYVAVPRIEQFADAEHFYSTLAHEHVHWTGHRSRLDRFDTFRDRFGGDAYATEELVAELGAAMWCGQMGIAQATRRDHAAYLAAWLRTLKADPKRILTVASHAQRAVDWLNTAAGHAVEVTPDLAATCS